MVGRKIRICVVGVGYVGLSQAVLLAQENEVIAIDIISERIDKINAHISPIKDEYIERYLSGKNIEGDDINLNLRASINGEKYYGNSDLVIIATPTNYDTTINEFDTRGVEGVVEAILSQNIGKDRKDAPIIVIKSTIPVGFTKTLVAKYSSKYGDIGKNILFSPEFLRESKALYDNLYPSRIIVGYCEGDEYSMEVAHFYAKLLETNTKKDNTPILYMNATEAEAVKLFSNTFLALRIAYFNELDTYAEINGLNAKRIIDGVCMDPRIGNYYNNPSFGYGGYCLPKDTKQLLASYETVPENLIEAIVDANRTRKDYITTQIIKINNNLRKKCGEIEDNNSGNNIVGIYKLSMKNGSDNFRNSSVLGIINRLKLKEIDVIVYEPSLSNVKFFMDCEVVNDFEAFSQRANVIVANRKDECLNRVKDKVYTRDIYKID